MTAPTEAGRMLASRYRLLSALGTGGMGTVWLAEDELLRRQVAVKEVFPPVGVTAHERAGLRERTLREARMAARLNHPNVVTIYDVLDDDARPWIVMELIPSRSLREVVQEDGPLTPQQAAKVGLQVLAALTAAHALGVMHRDVKPGNVLIDAEGRAVLADFGIARAQDSPTLTTSGVLLGSPSYIAPERARGEPGDAASDLWSLGATLYAIVEGRPPYEREGALPTLMAVVSEEPDPPRRAGPLWPVISGLLGRDPASRLGLDEAERMLQRVGGTSDTAPLAGLFDGTARGARGNQAGVGGRLEQSERTRAFHRRAAERAFHRRLTEPPEAARHTQPLPDPPQPASPEPSGLPGPPDQRPDAIAEPAELEPSAEPEPPVEPQAAEPEPRAPLVPAALSEDVPEPARAALLAEPAEPSTTSPAGPARPDRASAEPDASAPRRKTLGWVIAVAALVVVAVAGTVAGLIADNQHGALAGGRSRHSASPPAPSNSAPTASSPPATSSIQPSPGRPTPSRGGVGPAAIPVGYHAFRNSTGFSIAVPNGWRVSHQGHYVYLLPPAGSMFLLIDQSDHPQPNPLADWRQQEANRIGTYAGYHRIRLEGIHYPQAEKAADWEFTYYHDGVLTHVLNRNILANAHHAYALYWSTPASEWNRDWHIFKVFARTFRPAAG